MWGCGGVECIELEKAAKKKTISFFTITPLLLDFFHFMRFCVIKWNILEVFFGAVGSQQAKNGQIKLLVLSGMYPPDVLLPLGMTFHFPYLQTFHYLHTVSLK